MTRNTTDDVTIPWIDSHAMGLPNDDASTITTHEVGVATMATPNWPPQILDSVLEQNEPESVSATNFESEESYVQSGQYQTSHAIVDAAYSQSQCEMTTPIRGANLSSNTNTGKHITGRRTAGQVLQEDSNLGSDEMVSTGPWAAEKLQLTSTLSQAGNIMVRT